MKHVILLGVVLTSTGLLTACANEPTQTAIATGMPSTDPNNDMVDMGQTPGVVTPNETLPVDDTFEPTVQQTLDYMRYLGPSLIGRVLSDEEETQLAAGVTAVKPIIEAWVKDDGFVEAVKSMLEIRLGSNGKRGNADFNLPGYIVRHVVKNNLPWSKVVTSDTCYDAADQAIPCDTGAPYTAGVLTTRGFLAGNEGRFNLGRARAMLLTFMCRDYPAEPELQPYVDKPRLKLMFRASNADEQMVAEVAGGFGNGLACFSCHGQFSNHSQPFVKFDKAGTWIADADGSQSMTGQLGESDRGLMASHFATTTEAASEKAQWFAAEIDNLAGGAAVMAKNPRFHECAVQQLVDLGVGLDLGFPTGVKGLAVTGDFLTDIASSV
ncbi:MAG TPA: hypothetical protein VHP33_06165, partial [Polyangiaceae bacterium]|nr:hypothetical protein [Polyangiaceae bacterium]